MTSQQGDLYSRIRALDFNPAGSTFTFADRLASENGWSHAYAGRAIEEYRKFLLLAVTAGHAVSPPDAVDQVWHLHLLYTRSYWDEMCGNVLASPLHHEPSTGGPGERAKFVDWYANTLESYRRTFDCNPPGDIWPAPAPAPGRAPSRAPRHRRVDASRHWVIPRRGVVQAVLGAMLVIALLALASGCGTRGALNRTAPLAVTNPLDLRGPQFLGLYAVAFGIAMILAATTRASARGGTTMSGDREDLDEYEIAYLRGGPRDVAHVAVTRLAARGLLRVNPDDGTIRAASQAPASSGLYPVEAAALRAVSPTLGTRVAQVYAAVRHEAERVGRRLRDRELIVDESRAAGAATLATLIALSVPAVGVVKIFVGLSRGRPVGFLVVACTLTTLVALLVFARRPRRTRRGEAVLRRLRARHAYLHRPRAEAAHVDLPLAVALFGMNALAHTEFDPLRRTTRDDASAHGSSYAGSACGGSSDGGSSCGGSSCGGGGCGGGGCGGCGGS